MNNNRYWAMACHVAGLAGLPPWNVVLPLVIWLIGRDDEFINEHGKSALRFQITLIIPIIILAIMYLVFAVIWTLMAQADPPWSGLGVLLALVTWPMSALGPCLYLIEIGLVIVACIRANRNEAYNYPFSIRWRFLN